MTTRGKLRARYRNVHPGRGTGTETRRLVGAIDGSMVVPAHKHPEAAIVSDDWVRWDRRSVSACSCKTIVELPVGLVVIDEERSPGGRGDSTCNAALALSINESGGLALDWGAAIHVARRVIELPDGGEAIEHVVDIGEKRHVYRVLG